MKTFHTVLSYGDICHYLKVLYENWNFLFSYQDGDRWEFFAENIRLGLVPNLMCMDGCTIFRGNHFFTHSLLGHGQKSNKFLEANYHIVLPPPYLHLSLPQTIPPHIPENLPIYLLPAYPVFLPTCPGQRQPTTKLLSLSCLRVVGVLNGWRALWGPDIHFSYM